MPVEKEKVAQLLKDNLECTKVVVIDESDGCGAKYLLYAVSSKFDGVKLLDKHRMVQEALSSVSEDIHALTIKAWTPAQWEAKQHEVPESLRD